MTWGEEVGDLTEKDISAEEQDRLLSEYERELLTKKMKNGGEAKKGNSTVEDSIGEELAKLDMKEKKKGAKGAAPAGRKAVSPDKGMRHNERESVMCFLRISQTFRCTNCVCKQGLG